MIHKSHNIGSFIRDPKSWTTVEETSLTATLKRVPHIQRGSEDVGWGLPQLPLKQAGNVVARLIHRGGHLLQYKTSFSYLTESWVIVFAGCPYIR